MSGHRFPFVLVLAAVATLSACDRDALRPARGVNAPATLDAAAPRPPLDAFAAHVERVVDGDTVIASRTGGAPVRVRIIGIDSPEAATSPKGEQCHARAATAYAVSVLDGVTVRAAYEGKSHLDRYQRELWHVWLPDGSFFAGRAVALGHARALRVRPHVVHAPYIAAQQQQAQAAARGLWGACPQ